MTQSQSPEYDAALARSAGDVWQYWVSQEGSRSLAGEFGWVPDALTRAGIAPAEPGSVHSFYIDLFSELKRIWVERSENRDATMTEFLDRLGTSNLARTQHIGLRRDITDEPSRNAFARECQRVGIDFERGLELLAKREALELKPLATNLFELGAIDPGRWLRPELFEHLGAEAISTARPLGAPADEPGQRTTTLESPGFWFDAHPAAIANVVLPALQSADSERAARLAHGLMAAGVHPWSGTEEIITRLRTELLHAVSGELEGKLAERPHMSPEPLRHALIDVWSTLIWKAIPDGWKPSDKVVAVAQYELACWRQRFENAAAKETIHHFERNRHGFETCVSILFTAKPLWDAIRPLVLALRALTTPAVASDLRYWQSRLFPTEDQVEHEASIDAPSRAPYGTPNPEKPDPPTPWNAIPETIVSWFHSEVAREQESDPELEDLRHRFARFCLDRLKPDKKLGRQIEPDPKWRIGFIRAASELRVNPRGTGHRTLHQVTRAESEDPAVRKEAQRAYEQMRRASGLGKMSPRMAFIRALACLLRAHLEALDAPVNEPGAQATIADMVRRTTKKLEEITPKDIWA